MMIIRRLFAYAFLAVVTGNTLAEKGIPAFQRLTVDQGLSQGFVTAIAQDHQGFLWFGTLDGLNRYDGYSFTTYFHAPTDRTSLSDNRVSALAVDRDGALWVGTETGLNAYYPRTNSFERFQHRPDDPNSIVSGKVLSLLCDREGVLWVSTAGGLDRLAPRSRRFTHYRHDPRDADSMPEGIPSGVREDGRGNLIVSTSHGMVLFSSGRFIKIHLAAASRVITDYVARCLGPVRNGRLYVATDLGVVEVDLSRLTFPVGGLSTVHAPARFVEIDTHEVITTIEQESEASTWFGSFAGAIALYRTTGTILASKPDPDDPQALGGRVTCMLRDRSGNMWFGTNGAGVGKLDRSHERFAHITPSQTYARSRSVRAIYKDGQGRVWIGGYGGLEWFNRLDGTFRTFRITARDPASRASVFVRSISPDPTQPSVLWVGTENHGLYQYDSSRDQLVPYLAQTGEPQTDAGRLFINTIHRDRAGVLWVGTRTGLWRMEGVSEKLRRFPLSKQGDESLEVSFITESSHRPGWLWIASSQGLFLLEVSTGRVRRYVSDPQDPQSLSHDSITCILEDRRGRMWVGAMYGLNKATFQNAAAAPTGFEHYTRADGLPNDRIYGILEDEQGHLWMSTNKGLSRFDPVRRTSRNYDVLDGLQSNEFNFGAFYKASDGEMFFGGVNGISAFYPDRLVDSAYQFPVVFTGLEVLNRPIAGARLSPFLDVEMPVATSVHLSRRDRVVSFEFASLDYTAPRKNRYRWMMKGFDETWVDGGANRRATYTNLPAGAYTLLVKGSNSDGIWNPRPTSIRVVVAPPYWQTWWFRLIVGLTLAAAAYLGHRFATSQIRKRNLALQCEIKNRERTEKALALAREKYQSIFERARFGIFQVTPEGRFLTTNQSMAEILGYESPDQLLSKAHLATEMYVDREDLEKLASLLKRQKEVRDFQCQIKKRDGSTAWTLFYVRLVSDRETAQEYFEGMVQDISERKKLTDQLAHALRMESVGQLAGGVAHDFNNMLTVIAGYAQLAKQNPAEVSLDECLTRILFASEKAKQLTTQLLAFARKQITQPVVTSPNRLLQSLDPLLHQLLGEHVEVRWDLAASIWNIRIDPGQFEQAILNLAVNARDAMRIGGTFHIGTSNVHLDHPPATVESGASAGPFVLIEVSDTGVGIPKENLPHIFDPFFTTKAKGEGTGLGLSTVYGIVTQNEGFITVYSEPGQGTTFKIYLPREEAQATAIPEHEQEVSPRGTEVILFVEDEEAVSDFAVICLSALGYKVLAAPDGAAALELVRNKPVAIDLLVTDVIMPKMGGKQLASELMKTDAGLKVLYTSGYSENVIAHQGVLDSGVNFLQKPYTSRDLAVHVRTVLDQE